MPLKKKQKSTYTSMNLSLRNRTAYCHKISKAIYLFACLSACLITSCNREEWGDGKPSSDRKSVFHLVTDPYHGRNATRASEPATGYDRVECYIMNTDGTLPFGVKARWRAETSEIVAEGLREGDYLLLVLSVRGDESKDAG